MRAADALAMCLRTVGLTDLWASDRRVCPSLITNLACVLSRRVNGRHSEEVSVGPYVDVTVVQCLITSFPKNWSVVQVMIDARCTRG